MFLVFDCYQYWSACVIFACYYHSCCLSSENEWFTTRLTRLLFLWMLLCGLLIFSVHLSIWQTSKPQHYCYEQPYECCSWPRICSVISQLQENYTELKTALFLIRSICLFTCIWSPIQILIICISHHHFFSVSYYRTKMIFIFLTFWRFC